MSKIAKNGIFGLFEFEKKIDFTKNGSGNKTIRFQERQALTSHFESFWSISLVTAEIFVPEFQIQG